MTDRELMQQALDALDAYSWEQVQVATNALREKLAQPEQELVFDCPRCGHCCPQRPWVGLTNEDSQELAAEQHSWEGLCSAVETKLKEKNA
jgi:hypothetical protein